MERQNKFKVVIPSYNNEKWVEANVASILQQTYTNYDVLYINDASTDSTPSIINKIVKDYKLDNWTLLNWEKNKQRGYNVNPNEDHIINFIDNKEDIILFVDGDDWLYDKNVFERLNKYYNTTDCWMTYGGMYCYPKGNLAFPQNSLYSEEVHKQKAYRKDIWRASHLRSFRWFLYNKIKKEDLIWSKTGEYYYNAEDLAVSFFCMEMCPKEKIGVLNFPTYIYNEDPEIVKRGLERQDKDINNPEGQEAEIRSKTPYKELKSGDNIIKIEPILAGGLGNMMFQIASSYGLSTEFNSEIVTDFSHIGTLHKKPIVYKDNLFKDLNFLNSPLNNFVDVKSEPKDFTYQSNLKLSTNKDTKLSGYFQSYKYFEHCKEGIKKMFTFKPYNQKMGYVSLHIRRGDYVNKSKFHHNLSIDYYNNAIDYFKGYKFLVFSDDIEWCKQQFKGNEFEFIENNTDYDDLHLMSECEHNVIANSTFSWWAAYLNQNSNKKVIYPNKWFGIHYKEFATKDIFPLTWICLSETTPSIEINLLDNACRHLAKDNGRYSVVHDKISKHIKYKRDLTKFEGISLFTDDCLTNNSVDNIESDKKIGWLLETREVYPIRYEQFKEYKDKFDFIITHDKKLLEEYPNNTKFAPFGGCWIKDNNFHLHKKNKNISMIYSDKKGMKGHQLRHQVANKYNNIDLFGRGTSNPLDYKEDSLVDYRYSIVIENSKTDNYFTEKLIDCFAVGTIPIYWGCPNLEDYFNLDGIITFNTLEELDSILPTLNKDLYESKLNVIADNLEKSKEYNITEDWIYKNIINE